eukprot:CAMPEP_0206256630 /NCGR_PEP_ID=MMETSP0047_2-20121206/24882_1 /ASSEMBLY_ACC=CAM_ASM_000192 /TAXON_ID=195065 /ORGANISM="Chroomonas mesostigmatica_cf, Strain CCMP1168" /LENGTH=81 /DNA_ID=CAMNT_0053683107 /DNA_START=11 /DNA_END=253 /DNA_ORIENTATION=-
MMLQQQLLEQQLLLEQQQHLLLQQQQHSESGNFYPPKERSFMPVQQRGMGRIDVPAQGGVGRGMYQQPTFGKRDAMNGGLS